MDVDHYFVPKLIIGYDSQLKTKLVHYAQWCDFERFPKFNFHNLAHELSHRIKPAVLNNSFPVAVSMNTPSMVHPNITFGFRMSHSDRWTGSVRIGRYQSVMFVFHDMLFLLKLFNLSSPKNETEMTYFLEIWIFKTKLSTF